jgi:hypothetical protein
MPADVSLVLQKFHFDKDATTGAVLEMEGRNSGLLGQLLTAIGLTDKSTMCITRREVTFKFNSLGGITYIVCPLDALTCSISGIAKPMWMLVLGVVAILAGVGGLLTRATGLPPAIILIAIGGAALYFFVQSKSLAITFSTGDMSDTHGLAFEATSIDGKVIDLSTVLETIKVVNQLIVEAERDGHPVT